MRLREALSLHRSQLMDIGAIRFGLKQQLEMQVDVPTPNSLPASGPEQDLREALAAWAVRIHG